MIGHPGLIFLKIQFRLPNTFALVFYTVQCLWQITYTFRFTSFFINFDLFISVSITSFNSVLMIFWVIIHCCNCHPGLILFVLESYKSSYQRRFFTKFALFMCKANTQMLRVGKKENQEFDLKTDGLEDFWCQIWTLISQREIFAELGGQNGIPRIFTLYSSIGEPKTQFKEMLTLEHFYAKWWTVEEN